MTDKEIAEKVALMMGIPCIDSTWKDVLDIPSTAVMTRNGNPFDPCHSPELMLTLLCSTGASLVRERDGYRAGIVKDATFLMSAYDKDPMRAVARFYLTHNISLQPFEVGQEVKTMLGDKLTITKIQDDVLYCSDGIHRIASGPRMGIPSSGHPVLYSEQALRRVYHPGPNPSPIDAEYMATLVICGKYPQTAIPNGRDALVDQMVRFKETMNEVGCELDWMFTSIYAYLLTAGLEESNG